ncbi:MAG: hypothetical protein ABFD96_25430 [Armatimonadia bacterium]
MNSPSVLNYFIGAGVLSFDAGRTGTFRDLGNAPSFRMKPTLTKVEHNSSRDGSRSVDRTLITGQKIEVTIELEEITPANLALAFLGTTGANSSGQTVIDIFTTSAITGALKFVGSNNVGARFEVLLNSVEFTPDAEFDWISEEITSITLAGIATNVTGSFGTITEIATEATA